MAPHSLRVVSAGWREQEFLSSVPGFLSFVVHEVLNAEEQCDNTHKVFCDLLAELIKFNKVRIFLFFSSYFESVWIHVFGVSLAQTHTV